MKDDKCNLALAALSQAAASDDKRIRASIEAGDKLHELAVFIDEQKYLITLLIEHIKEWTGEWSDHIERVEESVKLLVNVSELILLVISSSNIFGAEARQLREESKGNRKSYETKDSLRRQLKTHAKNLNILKEQVAVYANDPPVHLLAAIDAAEEAIGRIEEALG